MVTHRRSIDVMMYVDTLDACLHTQVYMIETVIWLDSAFIGCFHDYVSCLVEQISVWVSEA